jgi:hypothetical protein
VLMSFQHIAMCSDAFVLKVASNVLVHIGLQRGNSKAWGSCDLGWYVISVFVIAFRPHVLLFVFHIDLCSGSSNVWGSRCNTHTHLHLLISRFELIRSYV